LNYRDLTLYCNSFTKINKDLKLQVFLNLNPYFLIFTLMIDNIE